MNITGVLVRARPNQRQSVSRRLAALRGVEVHAVDEDGKMVVTVEEADGSDMSDQLIRVHNTEGVLYASLIYNHFEEMDDQETSQ